MASTSSTMTNSTFPLLALPLEVREKIYENVMAGFCLEMQDDKSAFLTSLPPLFLVCHATRNELLAGLQRLCRFHISVLPRPEIPMRFKTVSFDLTYLMHLSIDFCCLGLGRELFDRHRTAMTAPNASNDVLNEYPFHLERDRETVDHRVAARINTIATSCLHLKTFTLHLLSASLPGGYLTYEFDEDYTDFLMTSLDRVEDRTRHTVEALGKLKVRDTVSIIAVGSNVAETTYAYSNMREAIAPLKDWQTIDPAEWPGRSLNKREVRLIARHVNRWPAPYRVPDLHLRMWYFQPVGSEALILPEYTQIGDGHLAYEDKKCILYDTDEEEEEDEEEDDDEDEEKDD